jgi:hypothetical protein
MTDDDLYKELFGLSAEFRSMARLFPDDSTEKRVANHCADRVDDVLEESRNHD